MKALLVVYSYHHKNTQKIAEVFAKVLDAEIVAPQQANPIELETYELVGFGAGIDSGKHYRELLDFADKLLKSKAKKHSYSQQVASRTHGTKTKFTPLYERSCKQKAM
jgi:flavodoxin